MSIAARCLHGAGLCVIPKTDNDYRPLALRHGPLTFISALLIAVKVLAVLIVVITPASADLSTITSARIVQLTNIERTKAGLSVLTVNQQLTDAAQQKANHMLTEDYFAHISPTGVTPWFWIQKTGYSYLIAGENLAIDFVEAENVVAAWMASPTHQENMLHQAYTETGVAIVAGEFQGGTSTIVVHMFGNPSIAQATTTAPPPPTTTSAPTPIPAVPTPTPSTAPVITELDTTPPATPILTIPGGNTIQSEINLEVTGEAQSTIQFLINNSPASKLNLPSSGQATHQLSAAALADGTFIIRAYATDAAGNQSAASSPLTLIKDTEGPILNPISVSFILSPATDNPQALLLITDQSTNQYLLETSDSLFQFDHNNPPALISLNIPFSLTMLDQYGNTGPPFVPILNPVFSTATPAPFLIPPTRFLSTTNKITLAIVIIIIVLLVLAIIIKVSIQRPSLIAHASLVALLASLLLLF